MSTSETVAEVIGRLRRRCVALRLELEEVGPAKPGDPRATRARQALATKLRRVEKMIFNLTQASFRFDCTAEIDHPGLRSKD